MGFYHLEMTMPHTIHLKPHHYGAPGKSRRTDIGLAIDAAIKEQVAALGAIPSNQYDPHDYLLEGAYHEVKSSEGTWVSIPNSEVEFALAEIEAGRDVIYDIVLQVDLHSARFLGSVPFSTFRHLVEPSKFLTWRRTEKGWVEERSHRVLLTKVEPLLT